MDIKSLFIESRPRIAFGGAAISGEGRGYGFGVISEKESIYLLHSALDKGIVLYDTAPIYGFGTSEERIGKAFSARRREVFIVSKSGVSWDENRRVDKDNSPETTKKMLEGSLSRLKTDYIDLFLIHWPDSRNPISGALEVLAQAQEEGKIRYIGLSNTNQKDIFTAKNIISINALQEKWNLFSKPDCLADNVKSIGDLDLLMTYATLDKGILTKRVDSHRKFDAFDARSWAPWWKMDQKEWRIQCVKEVMDKFCLCVNEMVQIAIFHSHNLHEKAIPLIGFRNTEQLQVGGVVDKDKYQAILKYIEVVREKYEA